MKEEMLYKKYSFTPIYELGQKVYHITPESDQGIIVDITYSVLKRTIQYNVVFGRHSEDDIWCYEQELSEGKIY
jgi:uncharacterized protein (UPF0303 family)